MFTQLLIPSVENITFLTDLPAVIRLLVLETYGDSITHKLRNLSLAAGLCDKQEDDKTAARMFIDAVKDMKSVSALEIIFRKSRKPISRSFPIMQTKRPILCTLFLC